MTAYYYNTNTHNTHKMYSFSRSSLLKPEIISNVYVLHCVSLSAFASLEYLSTNVLLTIILIITYYIYYDARVLPTRFDWSCFARISFLFVYLCTINLIIISIHCCVFVFSALLPTK
jgi:hypothetical protein